LAEKGPHGLRGGLAPVPKETSGLGGHTPTLFRRGTPPIHLRADLADDRFRLVLLVLRRDSPPLVEVEIEILLARGAATFLRLRDRRDELRPAPRFDDPLRWLSVAIELPVAARVLVGGVQNGLREEGVGHVHHPAALRIEFGRGS